MTIKSMNTFQAQLRQGTILAGMCLIGAVYASPSYAESGSDAVGQAMSDQSRESGGGIEEIVVTAQFREQSLQKTPIAITAMNAETLEARSQTNVIQAANFAPGVTLTRAPTGANGNAISATIRGVGQFDSNPALEPGVGMYVDDVYYSQLTGSVLELLDLDRVEVLRGPQGTLQGKNSIGGAIKLFSRLPQGDNSADVMATYGSNNRIEGRASADFSLVPEKLFARVSFVGKSQDGYVTRKDFACDVPTLTYTDVNGVLQTNVPNPIPSQATGKDCTLGHQGGTSFAAGRAMLRWLPSDTIENVLIADYTSDNSESPARTLISLHDGSRPGGPRINAVGRLNIAVNGVPSDTTKVPQLIPNDPYVTYATYSMQGGLKQTANGGPVMTAPLTVSPGTTLRAWGVSNALSATLSDNLSLKSITAYRAFVSTGANDADASPLNNGLGIDTLDHQQFSQELRLSGDLFSGQVEYTIGGFYFDQKTIYTTRQYSLTSGALSNWFGDDPVESTTKAVFAHALWNIGNNLNLVGGVRYTDDRKTYTYVRRHADTFGGAVEIGGLPLPPVSCPGFPPNATDCAPNYNSSIAGLDGASNTASTKRVDWRAALNYNWTPDLMTYVQFATGFKGGGVNPRPFNSAQVLPFDPETLTAYEFGVKSMVGRKMRLNGAVFYNKYKNVQVVLSGDCSAQVGVGLGFPCALPINGGDATVWGVELEGEFRPFGGLAIDGSLGYINFEYDQIAAGTGIPLTAVPPYTPEWKWNFGIRYEIDLGEVGSITPHVDVNYQSAIFTHPLNTMAGRVDPRTVANARLTWRAPDDTLSVALEVTNLFDKFYYINKWDLQASGGLISGQPAAPRQWAVSVKKRF